MGYCFADAWACAYDGDDGFVGGAFRHDGDVGGGGRLLGTMSRHLSSHLVVEMSSKISTTESLSCIARRVGAGCMISFDAGKTRNAFLRTSEQDVE